jgi:hypothetical protein
MTKAKKPKKSKPPEVLDNHRPVMRGGDALATMHYEISQAMHELRTKTQVLDALKVVLEGGEFPGLQEAINAEIQAAAKRES